MQALNWKVLTQHNICTLDTICVCCIITAKRTEMCGWILKGWACRTEVWRTEHWHCCETAAEFFIVLLSISCYCTAYWVLHVIMRVLLALAVVSCCCLIGKWTMFILFVSYTKFYVYANVTMTVYLWRVVWPNKLQLEKPAGMEL